MHGEVVGQVTEAAVIEVEEDCLANVRSCRSNPGVQSMAIAMAVRAREVAIYALHGPGKPPSEGLKVAQGLWCVEFERQHRGNLTMQQMVQVQLVTSGGKVGEAIRSLMHAGQGRSLHSRVLRIIQVRPASPDVVEQHGSAWAVRHEDFSEKRAIQRWHCGRD